MLFRSIRTAPHSERSSTDQVAQITDIPTMTGSILPMFEIKSSSSSSSNSNSAKSPEKSPAKKEKNDDASSSPNEEEDGPARRVIESYRAGYPRFSALLSSTPSFSTFRRFSRLRARLLLIKQDRLSALEERLDEIDEEEESPVFLGVSRMDNNADRQDVLKEIEEGLEDYDKFAYSMSRMLQFEGAMSRDITSLRNWLEGNGCISRAETAYLDHDQDLFSLAPPADSASFRFEAWVEDMLSQWLPGFRNYKKHDVSSDRNVIIYRGAIIPNVAKGLILSLITVLLLMPIVVCNIVRDTILRIVIVMVSTVLYLLVLSGLTRAKTIELLLAATTYATVLIVFVSGSDRESTEK